MTKTNASRRLQLTKETIKGLGVKTGCRTGQVPKISVDICPSKVSKDAAAHSC